VQWDAMQVGSMNPRSGELLREQLGQKRGRHGIRNEDRPRRTPPHTDQLLARAHKAGADIGAVCDVIRHSQAKAGVGRIMGMLSLAKKCGSAACYQASAAALELGAGKYQFVRRYLERSPQVLLCLRQAGALIRELTADSSWWRRRQAKERAGDMKPAEPIGGFFIAGICAVKCSRRCA